MTLHDRLPKVLRGSSMAPNGTLRAAISGLPSLLIHHIGTPGNSLMAWLSDIWPALEAQHLAMGILLLSTALRILMPEQPPIQKKQSAKPKKRKGRKKRGC